MLKVLLIVLSALGTNGIGMTTAERCEIVRAALDDATHRIPPLAMEACVLENNYRDGSVLVDVVMVRGKGKKRFERPFLMQGESCGTDVIPVSMHGLPRGTGDVIHVVKMEVRPLAKRRLRFDAWLHIFDPADPDERNGTIGIACGADNEGVLEKRGGRWLAVGQ